MNTTKPSYTLGLDIGIGSIGWAVVELDYIADQKYFTPKRLLNCGVRLFDVAEVPKTGESPAKARREARSTRRRLSRRKARLKRAKLLLKEVGLIPSPEVLSQKWNDAGPYYLRVKALDEKITDIELARAILHILKRRGFKSARKNLDLLDADEGGKYKDAMLANKRALNERGYRTIGEMFVKDKRYANKAKRNRKDSFVSMVFRDDLEKELLCILEAQARFGNTRITPHFVSQIVNIFVQQIHFSDGMSIERMIGKCTLEINELRAPRHSYSFEKFRLYQDLQNLRIFDIKDRHNIYALDLSQKELVIQHAWDKNSMTFKQLRKLLNLPDTIRFDRFRHQYDRADRDGKLHNPEEKKFFEPKGYNALAKACDGRADVWQSLRTNPELMDTLLTSLSIYKTDEQIEADLKSKSIEEHYVNIAKSAQTLDKFGHLSLRAVRKITPFLFEHTYDVACEKAGYHFQGLTRKKENLLALIPDTIKNPVVFRALTQSRKLINGIIRTYGSPTHIHIELAREMSKTREERRKLEQRIQEREKERLGAFNQLKELGIESPTSTDILKYRLWKQQSCTCVYSTKQISVTDLLEPNRTQIDHILPFSRSLDDSFFNKALVLVEENQNKGNRTPLEYIRSVFGHDSAEEIKYRTHILALPTLPKDVKDRLLDDKFTDVGLTEYIERDLVDTRYIARELKNHIEQNLKLADVPHGSEIKRQVYVFPGYFTAFMRHTLGIRKDRGENHRHHAMDAIVLAVASQSFLQQVSAMYKKKELHLMSNNDKRTVEPWVNFRKDAIARVQANDIKETYDKNELTQLYNDILPNIKPLFISRAPNTKATGPAHEQTLRSPKTNKGVLLNHGKAVADNGGMVRVDVFTKNKKYYFVPIYVSDLAKKQLPNKATTGKDENGWIEMTSDYTFLFSIHHNDYIKITDGDRLCEGYFVKFDRTNASLTLISHDLPLKNKMGDDNTIRKGGKTVDRIQKYAVDLFGTLHEIKEEKRRGIS